MATARPAADGDGAKAADGGGAVAAADGVGAAAANGEGARPSALLGLDLVAEHEQATSEMLALLEELQVRSKAAATSPVMLFFGNDKVKPPNEKRTRTLTSQLEATHPTL